MLEEGRKYHELVAEKGVRDMDGGKNLVTFPSPPLALLRAKDLSALKLQRVRRSAELIP